MNLTIIKQFIEQTPLKIYQNGSDRTVGIKWGYCKQADDVFSRKIVLHILNLLETDDKLFNKFFN